MKTIVLLLFLLSSSVVNAQENNTNADSLSVHILGYDPRVVGDQFAEAAATWNAEEKSWFKTTFIHKRGGFTVPEKPISYPFSKD